MSETTAAPLISESLLHIMAMMGGYGAGVRLLTCEVILIDILLLHNLFTEYVITQNSVCYNYIHELPDICMIL